MQTRGELIYSCLWTVQNRPLPISPPERGDTTSATGGHCPRQLGKYTRNGYKVWDWIFHEMRLELYHWTDGQVEVYKPIETTWMWRRSAVYMTWNRGGFAGGKSSQHGEASFRWQGIYNLIHTTPFPNYHLWKCSKSWNVLECGRNSIWQ